MDSNSDIHQQDPSSSSSVNPLNDNETRAPENDLVGGTFAVIESDPGVFTSLSRKLGIKNVELVELYDIEPWAVDHLAPHGLIFCFLWHKDNHRAADFADPAAERVWFANQLSDDACASHAILNVVLNCPGVDVGEDLKAFRHDTQEMSPIMKGLAISSSSSIRRAHNSLARPADLRGSLNAISTATLNTKKSASKKRDSTNPPPAKRAKTSPTKPGPKAKPKPTPEEEEEETYHFIGYVPAEGKVWELDGLKSGPLEVGELPTTPQQPSSSSLRSQPPSSYRQWMDVVRPALRMKMQKYGGAADGGSNIRFSLLAIVDGVYEKASDEWAFRKKERAVLERRLCDMSDGGQGWQSMVDPELWNAAGHAFGENDAFQHNNVFAHDFGARKMERDREILEMGSEEQLLRAWEECVKSAMRAKVAVEDELTKAQRDHTDHVKRNYDYEPFLTEFIKSLKREGLLNALLDLDENGKKIRNGKGTKKASTKEAV